MHIVNNPSVPFWGHIPDGVHPGLVIHIDGHIPHHSQRFSINLVKGQDVGHHAEHHSSIALHLNPRVSEDTIVLNSRHHKEWQSEDRHRHNHTLHRGHGFSITIHVESEYYRISINGQHLCNFHHRMPYHEVGALWIDGDVDIRLIEYRREYGGHATQPHFTPAFNPGFTPAYTPAFTPGQNPTYPSVPGRFEPPRYGGGYNDSHHGHHGHHY